VHSRPQPLSEPSIQITNPKVRNGFKLCHPDRSAPGFPVTRHSPTTTCAAFSEESCMKIANAINLNRKSGVAEGRDLQFPSRLQRSQR
jgi:hypothetical protein